MKFWKIEIYIFRFSCRIWTFWTSDSDSSWKTAYIAGWKQLENPNLVKTTANSVLIKLFFNRIRGLCFYKGCSKGFYKEFVFITVLYSFIRSNFNTREFNSRELVQLFQLYSKRLSPCLTIFGHKIAQLFF